MRQLVAVSILFALATIGPVQADPGAGHDSGHDWSGFYAGIVGGPGYGMASVPGEEGVLSGSSLGNIPATGLGLAVGATAGAQAQHGSFVFGMEGDISWTNLLASASADDEYYESYAAWDGLVTLRARAGVVVDTALLYVTAGVAAVRARFGSCYMADCVPADFGFDDDYENAVTQIGFAAGAGSEFVLGETMSAKVELLYVGLPAHRTPVPYDEGYEASFTSSAAIARVGLNWHFD